MNNKQNKIMELLEIHPLVPGEQLRNKIAFDLDEVYGRNDFRADIAFLVGEGYVQEQPRGNGFRYSLTLEGEKFLTIVPRPL